ncbi:aminopeptidase [bacterium]
MASLKYAIRSTIKDCLRVRQKETLLVISDEPLQDIGLAFYNEAKYFCKHVHFLLIPKIQVAYKEPIPSVASLMAQSQIVILATSKSLSHTQARRKACKNGARIVSLPGITVESFCRTMNGNYKNVVALSRKIADILTIGKTAHLTSKSGTDLTFSLSRVKGRADTGMVHESGRFSNLPAGEGCAGPAYGSANGTLIIDGSFPGIGKLNTPVKMSVKDGYVIRITGDGEAEKIRQMLRPFGHAGKLIAEVGIGTNSNAKFTGFTLEDEKVKGTVHVALGNNISFDGKNDVPCHYDGILLKPTLVIDGISILSNGILQV